VSDQAIFVAAEIEDHPVVTNEVDSPAELTLDLCWAFPLRLGG
jgi:hypothetical protein